MLDMAKKAGSLSPKDCIRLQLCGTTHQCSGRSFSSGKNFVNHYPVEIVDAPGAELPKRTKGNSHVVAEYRSFLSLPPDLILRTHSATLQSVRGGKYEARDKFGKEGVRPEQWREVVTTWAEAWLRLEWR